MAYRGFSEKIQKNALRSKSYWQTCAFFKQGKLLHRVHVDSLNKSKNPRAMDKSVIISWTNPWGFAAQKNHRLTHTLFRLVQPDHRGDFVLPGGLWNQQIVYWFFFYFFKTLNIVFCVHNYIRSCTQQPGSSTLINPCFKRTAWSTRSTEDSGSGFCFSKKSEGVESDTTEDRSF